MNKLPEVVKIYLTRVEVVNHSIVFRVHCRYTAAILFACSCLLTLRELVGKPIECVLDGNVRTDFVNTYCWIMTTYLRPDQFYTPKESFLAHPGIFSKGPAVDRHYAYYQWVCIVLFFQGALCYFPIYVWNWIEGGYIENLVGECPGFRWGLCKCGVDTDKLKKRKEQLITYLSKNFGAHNSYALWYWFCESLCLVNIVFQLIVMNAFFRGDFFTYGWDLLTLSDVDPGLRDDRISYIFPRVTKCILRRYGPSQTIEALDAMCVLPLNNVNDKIYLFLWLWYLLLTVICCWIVLYRIALICFPKLRQPVMKCSDKKMEKIILEKLPIGDWWLFYMLGKNIHSQFLHSVVAETVKAAGLGDFVKWTENGNHAA